MKVMTIVGARPQFIKAAVVSRAFREHRSDVQEMIVHTGQHYDANMSDVFFDELDIPKPDYNLGVGGGTHGQNTGRMLERLEALMMECQPDWVLVYGDTDSTLAGALAAAKLHVPVAHVEAGLRSFNRRMPEEINRILTDHAASLLFPPSRAGYKNLINEGIPEKRIELVGDVMHDAALYYKKRARKPNLPENLSFEDRSFVLCTIHRAENTENSRRLSGIFSGLALSGQTVILPLHPRTRAKISQMQIEIPKNVWTIDPVSYLEMVWLEVASSCIATDSGGVQKEAYFHGKRCVTLRDETEWVELVQLGYNSLVGTNSEAIALALSKSSEFRKDDSIYGCGDSAERIVDFFRSNYSGC